jgi:hypothetical protein
MVTFTSTSLAMRIVTIGLTLAFISWMGQCAAPKRFPVPTQYSGNSRGNSDWSVQIVRFYKIPPEHPGTVLSGIQAGDETLPWRWTNHKAAFRFWPLLDTNATVELDISVADVTLAQTGPVTVTVLANNQQIGSERYARAGRYLLRYEVPMPSLPDRPLDLTLVVEPPWISPADHTDLGVILASVSVRFEKPTAGATR